MSGKDAPELALTDGSRIAVIGGGPAGSFFTYFALDFANRIGLDISIDIFEAKDFNCAGPQGCNHCGGIISESLVQMMSAEGMVIPAEVIRRGIESYTMHLETGITRIETPLQEQRIAAVYRGFGPLGAIDRDYSSFDNYLLGLCIEKGARTIHERVMAMERTGTGIRITTKQAPERNYDLVVGAAGLSKATLSQFQSLSSSFKPPETAKTFICEFYLDRELINAHFGNSMHVFLLNLPRVKFGALIPKKHFVTLVMLGSGINQEIADSFVGSEEVKRCFPDGTDLTRITPCKCFPSINVGGAHSACDDRMVLIGDSASSKLYKNGLGAAFLTAKAAARTAIFNGIAKDDFEKISGKLNRELDLDNRVGKLIFWVTTFIQRSTFLKKGLQRLIREEQTLSNEKRRMSAVLWDTFTGSANYRDILKRAVNPLVILALIRNLIMALFTKT